jgi:3-deoxy-D-arabino-heptulosonate 7-phosphate (DAHP) synthase class II
MMTKRTVKQRHRCTGHELVQTWSLVKRVVDGEVELFEMEGVQLTSCMADATVIAQVALPCGMKDLCDECLKRYRTLKIVTRVLVELHSARTVT